MPADDLTDVDLVPGEVADEETSPPRTRAVKIYEIAVSDTTEVSYVQRRRAGLGATGMAASFADGPPDSDEADALDDDALAGGVS